MQKSISSPVYANFRSLLIEARKRSGLNQTQLARRLGKPQSYVSKYETGERRLDVLEFLRVTRHIGVDPVRIVRKLLRRAEPK